MAKYYVWPHAKCLQTAISMQSFFFNSDDSHCNSLGQLFQRLAYEVHMVGVNDFSDLK